MEPIIVLNFDMEDNNYDINVTPDKREIFITNEIEIVENIRAKLNQFFEDIQRLSAYNVNTKISGKSPNITFSNQSKKRDISEIFDSKEKINYKEPSPKRNTNWL